MTSDPQIRIADVADAEVLAELSERTFVDTFKDQNDPRDLEAYVRQAFAVDRLRGELAEASNTFFFALPEPGAAPWGYAKLRRGEADPSVRGPAPVEIERLYVDRPALGHGVGAALMEACLETGRREGYETIWLGVWEHNPRALRFYEKWGFEVVGSHVFTVGSDDQVDLILELGLKGAR